MAEVWAAHAVGPQGFVKPVAIKLILEPFSGDPQFERLFVNEARLAAQLQHPNLVTIFDFDTVPGEAGASGRYYIVMERVEGQDLRRLEAALHRRRHTMPVPTALFIAGEVLKGLRYVHERAEGGRPLRLVHRDVSPHNVMLDRHGQVKLSDFGIAKAMTQSLGTQAGTIRGKLAYASPEQIRGEPVDASTDQFAAGVVLWELLAGRRLFEGASDLEVVTAVARCDVPALADLDRQVHPRVEQTVRRMLAPLPRDRFASTAEALRAVLELPGYTPDGASLAGLISESLSGTALETGATEPLRTVAATLTTRATAASRGQPAATIADEASVISLDALSDAETRTRAAVPELPSRDTTPSGPPPAIATDNSAPDAAPRDHREDVPRSARRAWRTARTVQVTAAAVLVVGAALTLQRSIRATVATLSSSVPAAPAAGTSATVPPVAAAPPARREAGAQNVPWRVAADRPPEAPRPPAAPAHAVTEPQRPAPITDSPRAGAGSPPRLTASSDEGPAETPAAAGEEEYQDGVATTIDSDDARGSRDDARPGKASSPTSWAAFSAVADDPLPPSSPTLAGPRGSAAARTQERMVEGDSHTPPLPPQDAADLLAEARSAFEASEYPRAVRAARRAMQAGAGAPALVVLGDTLAKLGRTEEARRAYADALGKDPNNVGAQRGIQVLAARP